MLSVVFHRRYCALTDADRRLVEAICARTSTELRNLLPALPMVVHVNVFTRGRVIPQLGYGARAGPA